MTSIKLKKIFLGLTVLFSLIGVSMAPLSSQAAATAKGGIVNCQSALPGTSPASGELPACDLCQAFKMINTIFNYAVGFLGGAAVLMIIVAGFLYITAAGSEQRIGQAKKTLQYAIIGLVVVILAFVIVGTIFKIIVPDKPFLGGFDCKLDEIFKGTTSGNNNGSGGSF